MSKLMIALMAAGLALGSTIATAGDKKHDGAAKDAATQAQEPSPGASGDERRNRDSTQQGDVTPGEGTGTRPSANAKEPVNTGESTSQTPSDPSDPKDEMRNRDSSKQQPGTENQPPKQ